MAQEINTVITSSRNIRYKRGDDFGPIYYTFNVNSSPLDLTGSTFLMKLIEKGDATKTAVVSFSLGSGITIDDIEGNADATLGTIRLAKTAAQMSALEGGEEYYYDLQETTIGGAIRTWLAGLFIVENDTTI